MIILGLDPGTNRIGYGLIRKTGTELKLLNFGTLEIKEKSPGERLVRLAASLQKIINVHKPQVAAVESRFFFKNKKTALPVAEARGVILLTLQKNELSFLEFSPREVKSLVTGWGGSDKKSVQKIVALTLGVKSLRGYDDASDALAIAIAASFKIKN
ncbi:MAG TPA: crossover junction endodeoxyribonuclease RuvC [Candidatus Tyrphobacter sp.]|nr:crossover junction endodeoxyribonuclease RuvC [Candidatus Tyrphobacter sp.]